MNVYEYKSKYDITTTEFVGIVTDIKISDNRVLIYLKAKELLVVKCSYDEIDIKDLKLGDIIFVSGSLEVPSNNTIFNLFNYKKYLYNKSIYYIVESNYIDKVKNNVSVFYYIKNKIIERIDSVKNSREYIKAFILGDKTGFDDLVIDSYQNNGVSHLFSISGMHISLFAGIILFFIRKVSYNDKFNYGLVIIFLLFYMFLVNYTASILRSFMLYFVRGINKSFNLKINMIDLALISLVLLIIINSRIIYDIGFQYSYMVSFTLIYFSKKINKYKNYFIKLFMGSFMSFLVSIPICIYNFYQVNLVSIILNMIFVPIVTFIVFPLSLITFIIPVFDRVLYFWIVLIENISIIFSNISIGSIIISKGNIFIIIMYYIIIYIGIYNYKYLIFLVIFFLIHKNIKYLNYNLNMVTLDVGQGDSIFIELPFGKGNILIDTGGTIYDSSYSTVKSKIIPYLKSIGIDSIDYLICTHGDYDHMGEAINLVNNFKVDKVIFNCGGYNDLEKELISELEKKNIEYYSCVKELNIDKYKLYFLNTKEYDNENDNSNVVYFKYNQYKFLFMGDAGIEREKDILEKYNIRDIDFLKVGHHGSNTSSSQEFINSIKPKYSLISVGKNNRYSHPKDSVLDILENSKIHRTDLDGSIEIKLNKNGHKIKTCPP